MKVLYALQGTGNGHVSRAREILPVLEAYASFDVLISGRNCDLGLPYPVSHSPLGISMAYDDRGGISLSKSWAKLKSRNFLREVLSLPVRDYDLVICDFEPVSAYAALMRGVPSYALSHQAAFLSADTPRPHARKTVAESILRWFAPCRQSLGFHFRSYDDFIFGPVIRADVRNLEVTDNGHVIVYLPAFNPEVLSLVFNQVPDSSWLIFAGGIEQGYEYGNCKVMPVSDKEFLAGLASCKAVLCGAGFELPSEALFLKKKIAVIPIMGQYEQQCNAAALDRMGLTTFDRLPSASMLSRWLLTAGPEVHIEPADVNRCLDFIFEDYFLRKRQNATRMPRFNPSIQMF